MTTRTTGRIVGGLVLSAFFLYGGGSALLDSTAEGAASLGQLSAGATLLLLNSAAVATVGALAFRVLRRRGHRPTATTYLATRTTEAVLLALAPVGAMTLALLARRSTETPDGAGSWLSGLAQTAVENEQSAYWLAMATLGLGSIFFCRAMLTSGLLPRFLATWGIVGYAALATGALLELAGSGVGLAMSAPGGLFEVAAGSYLLLKGFGGADPHRADRVGAAAATTPVALATVGSPG